MVTIINLTAPAAHNSWRFGSGGARNPLAPGPGTILETYLYQGIHKSPPHTTAFIYVLLCNIVVCLSMDRPIHPLTSAAALSSTTLSLRTKSFLSKCCSQCYCYTYHLLLLDLQGKFASKFHWCYAYSTQHDSMLSRFLLWQDYFQSCRVHPMCF